jgi:hypothetical protein
MPEDELPEGVHDDGGIEEAPAVDAAPAGVEVDEQV